MKMHELLLGTSWRLPGTRGTRGAIYVEFLIAFLPVFCFFLSLVQFALLYVVQVMVKHGAEQTVRAAIVVIHDDPQYYDGVPVGLVSGKRKTEIERAANYMLGGTDGVIRVKLNSSYSRDEMVTLRLELDFPCTVPFGRWVVCDYSAMTGNESVIGFHDAPRIWRKGGQEIRLVHSTASLPNQGADYSY